MPKPQSDNPPEPPATPAGAPAPSAAPAGAPVASALRPLSPVGAAPFATPAGDPRSPQYPTTLRPGSSLPTAPMPMTARGPARPASIASSWPLRERAARSAAVYGIITAGVAAAALVPLLRPGVGWLLTGMVMVAALTAAAVPVVRSTRHAASEGGQIGPDVGAGAQARAGGANAGAGGRGTAENTRGGSAAPRPIGWENAAWAVATLALLGVGTVRAAGWLFTLCVLAAFGTGALAVGRGRTTLGLFFALLTPPVAAGRGIAWLARAAAHRRVEPQRPIEPQQRAGGQASSVLRTAVAVAVSVLLVVVFGALFASADPTFARVIDDGVPDLSAATIARWCLLAPVAAVLTLGGAFLITNPTGFGDLTLPPPRPLRRIEWVLPIGALVALFGLFIGVQFAVLFGDRDYVMRTAGLTFAQYARRGFWQLLVVTLLTLLVFAVAIRKAPRERRPDRALLRLMLGALAVCTLLIVASALRRMWVYEQAYGFSRLRLLVSAFELWLGLQFVLILIAGVRLRAGWLPRVVIASGVAVLLGLAVLNPDRFVAAQNIDRYQQKHKIDVDYLSDLSADAAVELDRLPSPLRECALADLARQLRHHDSWREYNAARDAARALDLPNPNESLTRCQAGPGERGE